jgi:hypothetical protein
MANRDQHEARPEKFTCFSQLGCDALSVPNGRICVAMLAAGTVGEETVFVDDVKEVAHGPG